MIALTCVLAWVLAGAPDCKVAADYGPPEMGIATNSGMFPAPPPRSWPPEPPVTRIRVHGRVQEAKMVKRLLPEYPKSACESGVAGTVHLLVIIGKNGVIRTTNVIEGDPRLSPAAESAIRQWKYKPTLIDGKRVEVETNIYVRFVEHPER